MTFWEDGREGWNLDGKGGAGSMTLILVRGVYLDLYRGVVVTSYRGVKKILFLILGIVPDVRSWRDWTRALGEVGTER